MSETPSRLADVLADRYRIERELGQGGMATVYLAEDLKHKRKVAIKVLRPELAAVIGAERFLREIQTIAALQHPHILGLIDSGEVQGTAYYVMPFVDGESLRDRLIRERQLAVGDAVRIASEVAGALDYAHRHGVIHRDIKPENILLHDGSALVADFGIALAVSTAGGTRMTETGMSLGTPHYMSPEQAMGEREITARSDLYALGCVTYEMLVGEPPFTGPTAQAIVARMMTEEPRSLLLQRKTVPAHVDDAVLTALAKIPADRFATAGEFAAALESESRSATRRMPRSSVRPPVRRSVVPVLIGGLVMAIGLGAWGWLRPSRAGSEARPRSLNVVLPDSAPIEFVGEAPIGVGQTAMALSPDGRFLVYVGGGGARPRLYVRPLDRFEATPLAGTEGAYGPFVSPDGAWIGFFADNQLKKVPVGGGPVSILADAPLATGAAWSEKGSIVFLTSSGSEIFQVSADGGRATTIARPPSGSVKTIVYLPGERWLLTTMYADEGFYVIVARSTEGPEVRVLVRQGAAKSWRDGTPFPEDALIGATPGYDSNGALLFTRPDGSLVSVGFDLEELATHGEPVVLALGVRRESWTGHGQVSLGGDGTLAYAPGSNSDVGVLAWLDRNGGLDTLPFPPAYSLGTDVAPDGARIAVTIPAISGNLELWVYDLRNGVRQRLLTGLCDSEVRWTPDGMGLLACLTATGVVRIYPARPGKVDTLTRSQFTPASVSRDGRRLLLGSPLSDSSYLLALDGRSAPEPITFTTGEGAFQPTFSPDGRWISYLGRNGGVFVEPYPITGEVYRISNQLEGDVPTWPNDKEIFFPSGSQLYVVKVYPGPVPRFDPPRILATQRLANLSGRPYAVDSDGRRFLIKLPTPEHSARSIRLIVDRHE